jgi:recombination protein RecA
MAVTNWLSALADQGLEVHSARDAIKVMGWLDTGCYALNWAISGRFLWGYPLGHTVEIFGDPSTGKSFLVARALARAQAQEGVTLLDDTEGAYNLDWMQTLGIDTGRLAYVHSRTVEQHLAVAEGFLSAYAALLKKKKIKGPGLLALDSLAQLSTKHEMETKLDKRDMTKAAEWKAFFRIVGHECNTLPVVHLSANHTIANIGNPWQTRTTPGGGGPKFHATVRVDLRSVSKIKVGHDYVGVLCRAVVDKNRIAPPWKEVRVAIPFHQPISRASGLIPVLLDVGVLTLTGQSHLTYQGHKLGLRLYKGKEYVLQQDEVGEALLDQIPELLEEADAHLAATVPSMDGSLAEQQDTSAEDE